MNGGNALAFELNCRFLAPFLDIVEERDEVEDLRRFLKPWQVSLQDLRNQSNWVSLRFCEALTDWLGERVGVEEMAAQVARALYSPRALGFLFPLMRVLGSPGAGYGRLPHFVSIINKVSDVRVTNRTRDSAEIEFRPLLPEYRENSRNICLVRKVQIASGPTLWGLPPARVDEVHCQVDGAASCRYFVSWVDRARWSGSLAGLIVGALSAWFFGQDAFGVGAIVALGLASGRLWDQRVHARRLQQFVEEHSKGLREALDNVEQRFLELQKAKQEVDVRVEERTAELKTATERRVHTEKLAVLGTLAAGLAHEVRNPANAIVTGLRPVKRHMEALGADQDDIEVVDIAIGAGEQISRLVSDLLDVGRTDRGLEPWDPHQGVESSIRLLSHRTEGITFIRDYQFSGSVMGRPPALNQIFLNLLDNAVRAAGTGGRVSIKSRPVDAGVEIVIEDSGAGVSDHMAQHIFDPFFTTREVGEGTGLGLHFSRQVAYDHGGTLDLVPSSPGWGANFRLWLPTKPRPTT